MNPNDASHNLAKIVHWPHLESKFKHADVEIAENWKF